MVASDYDLRRVNERDEWYEVIVNGETVASCWQVKGEKWRGWVHFTPEMNRRRLHGPIDSLEKIVETLLDEHRRTS